MIVGMSRSEGTSARTRAVLVAQCLVGALLVSGCAGGLWSANGVGREADEPAPQPTGACPVIEGQPEPTGCVAYDGDALMRGNEAYRQRRTLTDDERTVLEPQRKAALDALATVSPDDLSTSAVTRALEGAGFDARRVLADANHLDDLTVVTVIITVPGGCLVGSASDGGSEMDTTGTIADGGCVTAPGH